MVRNWRQFDARIRRSGNALLAQLDEFPQAVLVAGCQRSGTTAVARIIREAGQMANFRFTRDDELDAALILSGHVAYSTDRPACFQTTYLNERYEEYFDHDAFRLVWVLRRPEAVVYSMLYNWKRAALDRLFRGVGSSMLADGERARYRRFGVWGFNRLTKACLSYNAKIRQTHELTRRIPPGRLLVLDYESLVRKREELMPRLFEFAGIEFSQSHLAGLHERSIGKSNSLSPTVRERIQAFCQAEYDRAAGLVTVQ